MTSSPSSQYKAVDMEYSQAKKQYLNSLSNYWSHQLKQVQAEDLMSIVYNSNNDVDEKQLLSSHGKLPFDVIDSIIQSDLSLYQNIATQHEHPSLTVDTAQ